MKPRTIKYYFREAFRSIIVNRLMSIASIFTVASCILIVSIFFIIGSHVSFFVRNLGDSLGIVAFVENDVTPWELHVLEGRIRELPHISNVRYVSSEEALYAWRDRLGGDPAFLRGLDDINPLRRSFEIEITDVEYQEQVTNQLSQLSNYGIGSILSDVELGRILSTLSDVVQVITIVLIIVLGIVAVVIISNTINITVNARRTEINIMKYVGATDWFIRWPFIIEGILIGLIGSAIPAFIVWAGHDGVIGAISGIQDIAFIEFMPRYSIFAQLLPFALGLGIIIGIVGSGLSVRKHLKV